MTTVLIKLIFVHFRESFVLVKGAVLLLEEAEGFRETSPVKQGGRASDTQQRHLQAMIEQLRPEDTIKLVRPHVPPRCKSYQ